MVKERMAFNVAQRLGLSRGYLLMGNENYVDEFIELSEESAELEEWILANSDNDVLHAAVDVTREWAHDIQNEVFPAYDRGDHDAALLGLLSKGTASAQHLTRTYQDQAEEYREHVSAELSQMTQAGST